MSTRVHRVLSHLYPSTTHVPSVRQSPVGSTGNGYVVVIGDAFVDVVAADVPKMPEWGTDTLASSISLHSGGSGGNTSLHLAALDIPTYYVAGVGDDSFGGLMRDKMTEGGVVPKFMVTTKPTGSCIVVSGKDDRGFVSCQGANEDLRVGDITKEHWELLVNAKHVHVAGYFNCPLLQSLDLVQLCQQLREKGVSVSLDTQSDASQKWVGSDNSLVELLKQIDVFLPNETEAMALTSKRSTVEAIEVFNRMMSPGSLVVVTEGEKGAFVGENGKVVERCSGFPVEVRDPTGAGDAFDAGFLFGYLRGESLSECLRRGCAAGTIRVSVLGASDKCPSVKELMAVTES